ncbi:MAG: HEAT repeat domain-containing protein [Candidatus Thorarchaeota archaeon]
MSSKIRSFLLEFQTDEVGKLARKNAKNKKALIKAFSDTSDIVRERALIAAIDLADPEVVTDVSKALSDDVQDVRIAAAQALAFYHQPRTIPILFKGLQDESTWVRSHCAVGLSKIMNGPIWARLPTEDVEKLVEDFPEMADDDINKFLSDIKMKDKAIEKFMNWRTKGFDIDIDVSVLVEELEGAPIFLSDAAIADAPKVTGEVDEILSELPEEILATLPPEDIKRLTPASARELVQKLKVSIPSATPKKKKKKAVKVRKVKKVKKKKKATAKDSLIDKLPAEVRAEIGDDTLSSLSTEELEALLAATPESEEPEAEPEPVEVKPVDPKMQEFIDKYGEEKAELLITIPEVMLEGIPEDQIEEMDIETLKGLTQALEPRE